MSEVFGDSRKSVALHVGAGEALSLQPSSVIRKPSAEPPVQRNDSGLNYGPTFERSTVPDEFRVLQSQALGKRIAFPLAKGLNGQAVAAAVMGHGSARPTEIVMRAESGAASVASISAMSFDGLTWNSASTRMAAIERNYDHTPRSLKAAVSPHGPIYSDLVLTVFEATGTRICHSLLAKHVPNASVRLRWNRTAQPEP